MKLERKRMLKKGSAAMTPLLFIKLLRDVRTTWPRIVLMIFAMSTALVMFSAVLYTRGVTGREMSRAYLSTNPASATILLERGLDADQMATIEAEARKQPGIVEVTARTQLTLQVRQGGTPFSAQRRRPRGS